MNKQKRNLILMAAAAAAVVLAVILIAVLGSTGRGSEKATLTQYYTAMYAENGGGMDAVVDCLVPDRQQSYYDTATAGGTNFNQMMAWRVEAMSMVGDNVRVTVDILSVSAESASDLAQVRQTYSNAQRCRTVAFRLTLTGDQSAQEFVGVMPLVCLDGRWYMTDTDAGLKRVVNEETGE